jgi:tryptophanyl-tRNA synthetase
MVAGLTGGKMSSSEQGISFFFCAPITESH